MGNPIILKELIQTSHRRRTFVLRALLPVIALVILSFVLMIVLQQPGDEFEKIKNAARSIFQVTVWILMVVLPVLGALYASGVLHNEWINRTMEVLCATPLSATAIVFGKFASVMGRVIVLGLGLLPVMGVWIRLSRLPPELALSSLGVVLAGVLLFASLAHLRAAAIPPRRRYFGLGLDVCLLYALPPVLLYLTLVPGEPILVAAVPHWALAYVMNDRAPGAASAMGVPAGMSVRAFRLWAMGLPLGVALVALAVSPLAFRRSLRRAVGGGVGRPRGLLRGLRRGGRYRRPLRDRGNPFRWRELGPPTRILRWGLWIAWAITLIVMVAIAISQDDFTFFGEADFYLTLAWVGMFAVGLSSTLYGARLFAREKAGRTAQALILTGHTPRTHIVSKIGAMYRALWLPLAAVAAALVLFLLTRERPEVFDNMAELEVLFYAMSLLLTPLGAGVVGMVFSMTARSPGQAVGGLFLSLAMLVGLCIIASLSMVFVGMLMIRGPGSQGAVLVGPSIMVALAVGLTVVLLVAVKRWNPWILALVLALTVAVQVGLLGIANLAIMISTDWSDYSRGAIEDLLPYLNVFGSILLGVAGIAFWYLFGVRIFERSMLGLRERFPARPARPPRPIPVATVVR